MANNVKVIHMRNTPDKWQNLMLYLQNSTEPVARIVFSTVKKASYARDRMHRAMERQPTWFQLLVTSRGKDVYVIKLNQAQKVVIRDGR